MHVCKHMITDACMQTHNYRRMHASTCETHTDRFNDRMRVRAHTCTHINNTKQQHRCLAHLALGLGRSDAIPFADAEGEL